MYLLVFMNLTKEMTDKYMNKIEMDEWMFILMNLLNASFWHLFMIGPIKILSLSNIDRAKVAVAMTKDLESST
ncbi:hypothetical protein VNO77_17658 [Canavalia gladiata]|uniref:Uncharacterized protein n=1 Tax=Canavalia gladiata TaxID=3824 RepID=A0AAN9QIX0_CANGL